MNASAKFAAAVSAVDWNGHVAEFQTDVASVDIVATGSLRVALWARQLEDAYLGQPALSFVRAMQIETHYSAALLALALYKPAATTMRAALEAALYFVYFRNHPQELVTLVRDPKYYLSRAEIIEHLQRHEPRFSVCEQALGFNGALQEWYRAISGVVHGTIPGKWVTNKALKDVAPHADTRNEATAVFAKCVALIHSLYLCTVAQEPETWAEFSKESKTELLKGTPGQAKAALDLRT